MWRDGDGIFDINAEQIKEDQYVDEDDSEDGCFPLSEVGVTIEEAQKKDGKNVMK